MDLRRTILPLRSFPKLLLIISTITITAGFKLKQNGCLPLNSGNHPCLNLNYSFFIQCPENWVHIRVATSKGAFHLVGLTAREPSVKPLALNPDIRPFQSFLFCATSGTLLFTGMKRLFLPAVSCFLMKTPSCS